MGRDSGGVDVDWCPNFIVEASRNIPPGPAKHPAAVQPVGSIPGIAVAEKSRGYRASLGGAPTSPGRKDTHPPPEIHGALETPCVPACAASDKSSPPLLWIGSQAPTPG